MARLTSLAFLLTMSTFLPLSLSFEGHRRFNTDGVSANDWPNNFLALSLSFEEHPVEPTFQRGSLAILFSHSARLFDKWPNTFLAFSLFQLLGKKAQY